MSLFWKMARLEVLLAVDGSMVGRQKGGRGESSVGEKEHRAQGRYQRNSRSNTRDRSRDNAG